MQGFSGTNFPVKSLPYWLIPVSLMLPALCVPLDRTDQVTFAGLVCPESFAVACMGALPARRDVEGTVMVRVRGAGAAGGVVVPGVGDAVPAAGGVAASEGTAIVASVPS